jgi:uncharacterized damage-inducible protein DinB
MSDLPTFRRLARYNGWANRRLYDAVGQLDEAAWRAPRSGFFGSLQETLNHILVGDRIWLARFEGGEHGIARLDQILHPDFTALRRAREAEDARIVAFVDGLAAARLEGELAYSNMEGQAKRLPLGWALAHFFNHQTHHRGQAHAMLAGTAVPPPPLDLLYFLFEDQA